MTGGRQSAAGKIVMSDSFAKVISFVVFVILGWILRRFGILKAETFHGSSWICMKTTLEKTGFSDGQRSVEASV